MQINSGMKGQFQTNLILFLWSHQCHGLALSRAAQNI
jgi:hypothetical protein